MDFDEIVIGSGLAALGAVLGFEPGRRVLVLGGPPKGEFTYYDDRRTVPCAYLGDGGLGNHWHGVIPTGWRRNFAKADDDAFASLFFHFYPHAQVRERLGNPWLFVPWRTVRPRRELARIAQKRGDRLILVRETAQSFRTCDKGVEVTAGNTAHRARRLWIAAGALHTPGLLERSLGRPVCRGLVSDHVLCYVGQVENLLPPEIEHTRDGVFFPARYGPADCALYTLRPARFAFKRLDYGIEQRAVFGLPTGSALAKIMRRMSPGLLAEALYNRFGVFAHARTYSVYAQVLVRDAYTVGAGPVPLKPRTDAIRAATDAARRHHPFDNLRASRRPEMHLPGIHLHHSLDLDAVADAGFNVSGAAVQVIDASALSGIGPDHHSFKMMLAARELARHAT